jgi:hypothetical protein
MANENFYTDNCPDLKFLMEQVVDWKASSP